MRIAVVLNTSWNIYNFRMGLIRALLSEGHEVHAVAPHDEYSDKLIDEGCIYHPVRMDSRGANPIKDFALTVELFDIYRKMKPDVILQYTIKPNIYGTFAASLLRIPVINNVCGLGTVFLQKGFISTISRLMYKLAFRFPKLVFFQNQEDETFFIKEKLIRKKSSDVIAGSGIDLDRFPKGPLPKNKKFTFLLVSRLIHDKGILEYVEAIEHLKTKGVDARFQLLGPKDVLHKRGIASEIVDSWEKNNVLEYLGSTDDVRPFINGADCLVLPSYREGTPRSLLEGASTGRPLVATNVPGCTNIVEEGYNGFLCRPRNSEDLADKMYKMLNLNLEERMALGNNSRKKVEEKFNENVVIDKYLGAIASI